MNPKITIITACFNAQATITETIRSVLKQDFESMEHVIVDGGSRDNTVEIIKALEAAYSERGIVLRWVSERDQGIQDAYNKALALSTGEWTFFLNSGDFFVDAGVVSAILDNPLVQESDVIYGDVRLHFHKRNESRDLQYPDEMTLAFLKKTTICHQAVFFRRRLFSDHGNYDLNYRIASDFDRILVFFLAGTRFSHVSRVTCIFADDGVSGTNFVRSLSERLAVLSLRLGKLGLNTLARHYGLMGLLFVRRRLLGFIK